MVAFTAAAYLAFRRFAPLARSASAGPLLLPLGRASFYVFIVHVFVCLAIATPCSPATASAWPATPPCSSACLALLWRDGPARGSCSAGSRAEAVCVLDRPALAPPARHAAVDDVDDVARAEALEQARGDRRALAGRADRRDRPLRVDALRAASWRSW